MTVVCVRRYPAGPRVWVCGQRVHHGATGLVLAALLHKRRHFAAACLLACLHDRHDWRAWFVRERTPTLDVELSTAYDA